ncbi:MAG TPA: cytochrome c3 family protein [Myxococcota bacterium]|jgi:hypothetical protein|nr:cytochrome c3 family protein [Myxococcota bacterium]
MSRHAPGPSKLFAVLLFALTCAVVLGLPGARSVSAQQAKSSDAAYEAQRLAADPDAPGPVQPIPFSHALHAGKYQIDCLYCHSGTDRSRMAGVPPVETCMGCHAQFGSDLEGVQKLQEYWKNQQTIDWVRIHRVPDYVKFRHNRHVAAGVACQTCHGPVQDLHKLYLVPDTKWVNGMPADKLKMGWCLSCHWQNKASVDCLTCHY